jgi:threonine aldolase
MMGNKIDLRSDTVTWPTDAMRQAMASAVVGDDVYGDDPTVIELEQLAAQLLGKEAALFVSSGTMGNQLAIMAQTSPSDEVILSDRCHIVWHEAGAAALLSSVQTRCLPVVAGKMDLVRIEDTVRKTPEDIHSPTTRLICLENADSDGYVHDLSYMRSVRAIAQRHQIAVHLDGARLFNATAALGISPAELSAEADTVTFCLSKGLCAPFGSILAGPKKVIDLARRKRKILGGGLRQSGIMAAAGLIALQEMAGRIGEDHENATYLAQSLAKLGEEWFAIERQPQINMVFVRPQNYPLSDLELVDQLRQRSILVNAPDEGVFRFVCHYWVTRADLDAFLRMLEEFAVGRT